MLGRGPVCFSWARARARSTGPTPGGVCARRPFVFAAALACWRERDLIDQPPAPRAPLIPPVFREGRGGAENNPFAAFRAFFSIISHYHRPPSSRVCLRVFRGFKGGAFEFGDLVSTRLSFLQKSVPLSAVVVLSCFYKRSGFAGQHKVESSARSTPLFILRLDEETPAAALRRLRRSKRAAAACRRHHQPKKAATRATRPPPAARSARAQRQGGFVFRAAQHRRVPLPQRPRRGAPLKRRLCLSCVGSLGGASVRWIEQRLGHTDVNTTTNRLHKPF